MRTLRRVIDIGLPLLGVAVILCAVLFVRDNLRTQIAFVGLGMVSQITAGSLLGQWGNEVKEFTLELLEMGLVHVIASDTHMPGEPRPPGLAAGAEAASRAVGTARAQAMVGSTPRAILENLSLE